MRVALVLLGVGVLALLLVVYNLLQPAASVRPANLVAYSELLTAARAGQVREVMLESHVAQGVMTDGRRFAAALPDDPTFPQRLAEQGVLVSARPVEQPAGPLVIVLQWLPMLLFLGVLAWLGNRLVAALRRIEAALDRRRPGATSSV